MPGALLYLYARGRGISVSALELNFRVRLAPQRLVGCIGPFHAGTRLCADVGFSPRVASCVSWPGWAHTSVAETVKFGQIRWWRQSEDHLEKQGDLHGSLLFVVGDSAVASVLITLAREFKWQTNKSISPDQMLAHIGRQRNHQRSSPMSQITVLNPARGRQHP